MPLLTLLFDWLDLLPPRLAILCAVATSLACIVCTSAAAAWEQSRSGNVDWQIVKRWGPYLVLGSFLAASIASRLSVGSLRGFIGLFFLLIAGIMLTRWSPPARQPTLAGVRAAISGLLGGATSGIAGIGGGNVIVPSLIYFNVPIHRATATSSTLGIPIAFTGLLGYLALTAPQMPGIELPGFYRHVYWPGFACIAVPAMLMAPVGVRAAQRIDPLPLRRIFGMLLLVVSARMLYGAWMI